MLLPLDGFRLYLYLFYFDFYGVYICIFRSCRIYAQVTMVVLTYEEALDDLWYTRKDNSLRSVLVTHKEVFLVILTYEYVSNVCCSLGKFSSSLLWLIGELVSILITGEFSRLSGEKLFFHNSWGSCFGALDPQGVLNDIGGILFQFVTYWGVRVNLTHEEFSRRLQIHWGDLFLFLFNPQGCWSNAMEPRWSL